MDSNEKQKLFLTQNLLRIIFGIIPIVAGLDKFTNLLVNWEVYINPLILKLLPVGGHTFMAIVGVIEIAAGILVLVNPRIGAYVVSAWLTLISLSLLMSGHYLDVAVRDLVMAVGAFALARLTEVVEVENKLKASSLTSVAHI